MDSLIFALLRDGANFLAPYTPSNFNTFFENMKLLQPLMPLLASTLGATVPYSEYILAPESRTLYPVSVYQVNGTVTGAETLTGTASGSAVFKGVSSVTFDYEKNIAGVVSVTVGSSSSPDAFIGLTYTESSYWISGEGSDATGDNALDEVLWLHVGKGPGVYTVERWHERGAFKYLNLISNTTASVEVTGVSELYVPMNAELVSWAVKQDD